MEGRKRGLSYFSFLTGTLIFCILKKPRGEIFPQVADITPHIMKPPNLGGIMSCSMRFAIPATEENRELIRWLFHGLDADNCGEGDAYRYEDADERVLFFTINRSGVIGNRKSINRNHIHRLLDDNRCNDNSVHLLEVTKI